MGDSNAKKPSDNKNGDWDFKIDAGDVNENRAKAPVTQTGVHKLLNKRVKDERLDLNTKDLPKAVSRSNTAHYINNNSSKRKQVASTFAPIGQRLTGAVVDIVLGLILWQAARMYSDWTFSHLLKLAVQFEMKHYLELPNIYYAIVAINYVPLYLLVFFTPAWLMNKTPGKFVAKTTIDDIDGGDLGMFLFQRFQFLLHIVTAISCALS